MKNLYEIECQNEGKANWIRSECFYEGSTSAQAVKQYFDEMEEMGEYLKINRGNKTAYDFDGSKIKIRAAKVTDQRTIDDYENGNL